MCARAHVHIFLLSLKITRVGTGHYCMFFWAVVVLLAFWNEIYSRILNLLLMKVGYVCVLENCKALNIFLSKILFMQTKHSCLDRKWFVLVSNERNFYFFYCIIPDCFMINKTLI